MGGGGEPRASHLSSQNRRLMRFAEANVAYGDPAFAGEMDGLDMLGNMANHDPDWHNTFGDWSDGLMNAFTAVNGPSSGVATVSPKDLFQDSSSTMPPSATFTNLTTPGSSFLTTPDDAYDTSPLFDSGIGNSSDNFFPLFNDADDFTEEQKPAAAAPLMERSSSGKQVVVHPGGSHEELVALATAVAYPVRPTMRNRATSIVPSSNATISPRMSSVAGINKRKKELKPIIADENDHDAMKRAKNTAAARKSRTKKLLAFQEYESRAIEAEEQLDAVTEEKNELLAKVERLEARLRAMEAQQNNA
ncbi:General control protein [Elasticomyces elasticus]|nr:General control protein [Elasticomyces elasticus]